MNTKFQFDLKSPITGLLSKRKTARLRGHNLYFTGKPCKNGHIAPRYVSSGICLECIKKYRKTFETKQGSKKINASVSLIKKIKQEAKTYGPDKLTVQEMANTPSEARALQHSHYFTGKYCKHGHIAPRATGNATCVICNREQHRK